VTKVLTDGAGRNLITIDAEGNASTVQMDNGGGVLKSRDANDVGFDAVYDELARMTVRTEYLSTGPQIT